MFYKKNNMNKVNIENSENNHADLIEHEIDEFLKDKETLHFRNTLIKVHGDFIKNELVSKQLKLKPLFHRAYVIGIAASIAILIGVLGVFQLLHNPHNNNCEELFSQYYKPYQADFTARSDQVVINNLVIAFQLYDNHEYDKAADFFKRVVEADESILMAHFYLGVSSIEIGDYKKAIESFNFIIKNESNPFYPQAKWYSALIWLKLNNSESAKQHLLWLVNNDRFYGVKAKEILVKLKK